MSLPDVTARAPAASPAAQIDTTALRASIEQGRQAFVEAPGRASCFAFAAQMDARLRSLFETARTTAPVGAPGGVRVALVAQGGYGRRELGPYSDLDLLFLVDGAFATDLDRFVQTVLYALWDLRIDVGHVVRTVEETIRLAREDLAAATALLDARLVVGDASLFEELREQTRQHFSATAARQFVGRLESERAQRSDRFGDSVYLLEPNLKSSRGGLRDLMLGLWAAKVRFGVRELEDLPAAGAATPRQTAILCAARDFLWRVRTAAHVWAKRRQDHLLFEVQEAIAPVLTGLADSEDNTRAVEELMRNYYLHARLVARELPGLLERCRPAERAPVVHSIDEFFVSVDGSVELRDEADLAMYPELAVRAFCLATARDVQLTRATRDFLTEEVASRPDFLTGHTQAGRHFSELLCDPRDRHTPSQLEGLHDAGLLISLLPEMAPCTARAQHDIYHAYTVDQHSLYAIGFLKAIARNEHQSDLPLASELISKVQHHASLYLGTLLHDVGKPLGSDHSGKGAALAVQIATRLELADDDVRRTELLVRHHLTLAHMSQRRDLTDRGLVERFAATVGDREALYQLYLLTVADTAMTSPTNLTSWKLALYDELVTRTLRVLDGATSTPSSVIEESIPRVDHLLRGSVDPAELRAFLESMPANYFEQHQPAEIARHVQLVRRQRSKPLGFSVAHNRRHGYSEVVLSCQDAPGLLARITGVMLAHRLDIVGAQIHTRDAGNVLDVFHVRDRYGRAVTDPDRWRRVRTDLTAVLTGSLDVNDLIARRRPKPTFPSRRVPRVPSKIFIDNQAVAAYTVLDVITQDRTGVLYAITEEIAALGLNIYFSRVSTEANRVADSFYVRDSQTKQKLTDPERIAAVRDALLARLARITEEASP